MKLSIHETIRGKPAKDARVNLGYGWLNIEAEWPEVFELITVDGVATSAELTSDNRREANFVSRELLMVDIDEGMTIPELLDNQFYNQYGAGFYVTPSHTHERPRFRIMFRLEQPETDSGRLRRINRGLLHIFAAGDDACKDPTRIFYGTPNCEIREQRNVFLTNDFAETLIQVTNALDADMLDRMDQAAAVEHAPLSDPQRQRVLELLKQTFVGNYPIWRNIGWGLKAGGFSLADFQYVTLGMMNQKSAEDARTVWNSGRTTGTRCTMGTVIHFLREKYGADALQIKNKKRGNSLQQELYTLRNSLNV